MKFKYITPLFFISFFFASCEKKEAQTSASQTPTSQTPTKENKSPVTPAQAKKSGIPAVEAVRGIGKDLEKNAEQSDKLLEDAMGKHQ